MKKLSIFSILVTVLAFTSCQKKPDIGGTSTQKMANEWWVELYDNTGNALTDFANIATYNTAANNSNEIWIDDQGHVWDFKVKATANLSNLTFTANQVKSVVPGYDIKVNITEGKIIENGGHSKTGVLTDSIYMKIEFEDDPGTIYTIRGHARTRFAEDDY